jgi:hypothetical protein
LNVRNVLAHGIRPEEVPAELVTFLLDFARRLVRSKPSTPAAGSVVTASATVFRPNLNRAEGGVRELAEQANGWLQAVLGDAKSLVSAEWDLAEDGNEKPVVVLTLSDFTGKATTTFAPSELSDERRVRFRLTRLWGDLLRMRTHAEVRGLEVSTTTGVSDDGQ